MHGGVIKAHGDRPHNGSVPIRVRKRWHAPIACTCADARTHAHARTHAQVGIADGLNEDLARARAVRAAIGDGVALMVDANAAWPVETAVHVSLHTSLHMPTYMSMHLHTHVWTHPYAHLYTHVYMHVYAHVSTHVYMHVYAPVYTCRYALG